VSEHAATKLLRCLLTLQSAEAVIATLNNMKLIHWPLMGGLLHLVQRGGDWARPPITVLHDGPLLCDFNVPFKGLSGNNIDNDILCE